MAMNVNSTSSSYRPNSIAGLNSGLDTESIVDAMVSDVQGKIDKNKQDAQVAKWQQEAYRSIITELENFYNDYFRFSSSEKSILNPKFFDGTYCNPSSDAVKVSGSVENMSNLVINGKSIKMATGSSLTTSHVLDLADSGINGKISATDLEKLKGTSIDFTYNDVTKKIVFNESENYSTPTEFIDALNQKLDVAFGSGNVVATLGAENKFSIETSDSSSQVHISSASAELVGSDGALGITVGSSNKMNPNFVTLDQINGLNANANGKFELSINGNTFEFDAKDTLGSVMSKVNTSDVGAKMSFSTATNTFSLVSTSTGSASQITISGSLGSSIFGEKSEQINKKGTDFSAQFSFDGGNTFTTVTRASNSFTLDGVNYTFTGLNEKKNITFASGVDTDSLVNKVKDFVGKYNSIMTKILKEVNAKKYGEDIGSNKAYLPLTDAQRKEMTEDEIKKWEDKAKTGLLRRDQTLQDVANKLRSAMTSMVDDKALFQYGIDTKSWVDKGVLTIDEEKLRARIEQDPNGVAKLFSSENGIASKVNDVISYAIKGTGNSKGVLIDIAGTDKSASNDNKIAKRLASLTESLSTLEVKLDKKRDFWWRKFTRLESYISSMNSQSTFLSSMGQ